MVHVIDNTKQGIAVYKSILRHLKVTKREGLVDFYRNIEKNDIICISDLMLEKPESFTYCIGGQLYGFFLAEDKEDVKVHHHSITKQEILHNAIKERKVFREIMFNK